VGTITLLANGKSIGAGRVEKTAGFKYSLYEGQDVARTLARPWTTSLHAALQVHREDREGDSGTEVIREGDNM
jgi:hypothetical protein